MSIHNYLYRRDDPATSVRAARRATDFLESHESVILGCLVGARPDGLTYREIATLTGMEPVAVARRLKGMERNNLITRRCIGSHYTGDNLIVDFKKRDGCAIWWAT